MYLTLAFQLYNQHKVLGSDIVGKRILLCSYGSGNTMTVISGRISEGAPAVIERWNLDALLKEGKTASFKEYQQWIDGSYAPTGLNYTPDRPDASAPLFTLNSIRDDGYREYGFHGNVAEREANQNKTEKANPAIAAPVVFVPHDYRWRSGREQQVQLRDQRRPGDSGISAKVG